MAEYSHSVSMSGRAMNGGLSELGCRLKVRGPERGMKDLPDFSISSNESQGWTFWPLAVKPSLYRE